jgi:hypothetical protein
LGDAAVDEEFHTGDIAAVVRGEKYHCLRDFVWRSNPAERNSVGKGFDILLGRTE